MMSQNSLFMYIASILLIISVRISLTQANTTTNNAEAITNRTRMTNETKLYGWSSWGNWTTCSKTCGGGVAIQQRYCIPKNSTRIGRNRRRRRRKLTTLTSNKRRSARAANLLSNQSCSGVSRRYHECNIAPCTGVPKNSRAEQCTAYDKRPFRGRYYAWVPYIDGNSPCTLNCRPRGKHFYASLALVKDGTPCTKPGYRAICVQGSCEVVGSEGVLSSSSSRELRCGDHLVSGLFTRQRLPIGYSHIVTIPRGACSLNVSEITPSPNYIALKLVNGSYITNGEFAVSSPGSYDAAGVRFYYSRRGDQDVIHTYGPILDPVDIMILYTVPNPAIKYEYFTNNDKNNEIIDSSAVEHPTRHQYRHYHKHNPTESHVKSLEPDRSTIDRDLSNRLTHSESESNEFGEKRFVWKILSYSQCTRSCGGGLQIGKYRCVEVEKDTEKEVFAIHCKNAIPAPQRRRCGLTPCPARWRTASWGTCPICGPAHRTRIVGCVQDNAKGITKVSDQRCPLPMPPTSEQCNIHNCDGSETVSEEHKRFDARRQVISRVNTDTFKDSQAVELGGTTTDNISKSPVLMSTEYTHSSPGGWLHTEWSMCVGWCVGGGIQTRAVRCSEPAGCTQVQAPESTQECTPRMSCDREDNQWFTSDWSPCSAKCGGLQVRSVICMGNRGRRLPEAACTQTRPESQRQCGGSCKPTWYLSDWSECRGPCEAGIQSRTVWCAASGTASAGGAAPDSECSGTRPSARRTCVPARCSSKSSVRVQQVYPQLTGSRSLNSPRVTRNQNRSLAKAECLDRLTNCALAVQARLCHYPYYSEYCCQSCKPR